MAGLSFSLASPVKDKSVGPEEDVPKDIADAGAGGGAGVGEDVDFIAAKEAKSGSFAAFVAGCGANAGVKVGIDAGFDMWKAAEDF